MNPYTNRSMLKDPNAFYGREADLSQIFTSLSNLQPVSIVGPRRIGKSSLLLHLTRPAVYQTYLPDPATYLFAFIDLQELSGQDSAAFFTTVVERMRRASASRLTIDVEKEANQLGLRRVLERASDANLRVVLCLDEFEMLAENKNFGPDFFSFLRGLFSQYNFSMITSSRASLFELCQQGEIQTSQFWNVFSDRNLGLMPRAEATRLASEPFGHASVAITPAEVGWVLDLAGFQPFYIQIACYHLYDAYQSGNVDRAAVEVNFNAEAERHFTYAWEQCNPAEKSLLAGLAGKTAHLTDVDFNRLSRKALVSGSAAAPLLFSNAWEKFILGRPAPAAEPVVVQPPTTSLQEEEELETQIKLPVYQDFDLLFEALEGAYRARVVDSPAGQVTINFQMPFDNAELENLALLLSRPVTCDSGDLQTVKDFGKRLFTAIFTGSMQTCLERSLDVALQKADGLRIRLRLKDAPGLYNLPWEFLCNPENNQFYSLSAESPIVRYLDMQQTFEPLEVKLPLRILAVISSPSEYTSLDVEKEWKQLSDSMKKLVARRRVIIDRLEKPTLKALHSKLVERDYHILHFVGHGVYDEQAQDGFLIFEDDQGNSRKVNSQELGTMLHDERSLHLVVLNACEGARVSANDPFAGVAQGLVKMRVPVVIAMQYNITDQVAIGLSHEFYTALSHGLPVDAALAEARKAIYAEFNGTEWGTPVLYMRSPNGYLFNIQKG